MKGGEVVRVVSADLWENVEGQTMSEKGQGVASSTPA